MEDLLGTAAAAAISAVLLAGFAWVVFRAGVWERKRNLRRALRAPDKYPRWKKEGIVMWRDHVQVINELFKSEAATRPFSSDELRGIAAFAPDLARHLEKHRELLISDAIDNTRRDLENRQTQSSKIT